MWRDALRASVGQNTGILFWRCFNLSLQFRNFLMFNEKQNGRAERIPPCFC